MMVPISSSRAIPSATARARGLRTWSSSELRSMPEHEIRSALARKVEAERWTRLDAAIRMAADESASSTCGWTIRASTIRRRAHGASPRLQGRAND
jgi:hypothetical protein